MLELDHLAVAAETLEQGVAHVEERLGVELAPGGRHAAMATHNRLLRLDEGIYLEVIAVDPEAPAPPRARWFDLDRFRGPPRLSNWVARCDNLSAALARSPANSGSPVALERGELRWQMAVPEDGQLPWDGLFPALMEWESDLHPAALLPDGRCRLESLDLEHPRAAALAPALGPLLEDPRIHLHTGDEAALRATIRTPGGIRHLD